MQSFVIVSTRPGAGKTALAAALVELLRRDGRSAGYFKAFEADDAAPAASTDARFMGTVLRTESTEAGASLGSTALGGLLKGERFDTATAIERARRAGDGRDVLIVEGGSTLTQGLALGLSSRELADALDGRVIVVARYDGESVVDEALAAKTILGERLLGVVVTGVPRQRWDGAADRFRAFFGERGVGFLGALPFEEKLASVTVGQLAAHLDGQIMNSEAKADDVIENFMVGTVVLGKASDYFRRLDRKAVIAHGSRPDMHLAALETDTRCLVLAGNVIPNPIVLARAEEEDVPIVMVRQDTLAVLEQIEGLFPAGRFAAVANVSVIADLAAANLDLSAVRTAAGAVS
ncbi:MAG: AAA family ATPase [Dehalococcoidia bacterium]